MTVPLEDISSVLIESPQVTLIAYAAAAMANHGITVFLCRRKHLPSGQILPINQFCRQRKLLLSQCEMGKPLQKQLWQQIVVRKIQNQAQCLRLMGKEEWQELQQMAGKVLPMTVITGRRWRRRSTFRHCSETAFSEAPMIHGTRR
ncbi:MAG: CRISPR-associated endonuclease Cas1 [Oscillibacter sp.]